MSEKELAQQCFSAEEDLFIRDLIQIQTGRGSGAVRTYTGWYPRLFYRSLPSQQIPDEEFHLTYGADSLDAIVADVHTDVPCPDCGDPGSVLHEGIGRVNLLMMAVENGADRMVVAGPVLSHYEFEVIGSPRRLNDKEWEGVLNGSFPSDVPASRIEGVAPPPWTSGYLVPK